MLYDYQCSQCSKVLTVEKSIKDPHPDTCPYCLKEGLERHFSPDSVPAIIYANRPAWTYSDIKRYKNMRIKGGKRDGQLLKVDPSKHGDLGSWNTDLQTDKPKRKKK